MNDATAVIELDGADLHRALARMSRLGRRTPGDGTWSVGEEGLLVAWMGMSELLTGTVDGKGVVVVPGPAMHGLARVGATWPTRLGVELRGSELKVGSLVLDADLRERPPPQLLPLNAAPADLVRLHVREDVKRIEDAGLGEAVEEALARLDRTSASAARHLTWLGISPEELRAWVLSRHAAPASRPEPEIVVVEPSGQVRLFEDR